jgi:hypothetical protein
MKCRSVKVISIPPFRAGFLEKNSFREVMYTTCTDLHLCSARMDLIRWRGEMEKPA